MAFHLGYGHHIIGQHLIWGKINISVHKNLALKSMYNAVDKSCVV